MPLNCFYAPITSAIFRINKSTIEFNQIEMLNFFLKQSKCEDYCRVCSTIFNRMYYEMITIKYSQIVMYEKCL